MVAKRIPVAFMSYNRDCLLISRWNVYWWVYCKRHSSSSTTRPSSPDQSIGFQQFAKASTRYSLCFQICTASPEEGHPPITAMEYDHDMTEYVKNRQSLVFHAEVNNLPSKSRHRTTLVLQLRLFLDDGGLLPCGGRIHSGTLKWQHQISSAAIKQIPLNRSSNLLHLCRTASCRCQLYTHRPALKLLGSLWPTTRQKP